MNPGGGRDRGTIAAMKLAVWVGALLVVSGCAVRATGAAQAGSDPRRPTGAPAPTLESQITRTRALSAEARPRTGVMGQTVESWDPQLSAALAALAVAPTAAQHRRVASEYRRLGILDVAYSHLTQAVRLDPDGAAAHDALARIWRDWGFPHLGFADARKAVTLAPTSAAAANTLATLYSAAGQLRDARDWYERALTLDPGASYALNNFCYTAIVLAESGAVHACTRAAAAQPGSKTAHNNLALAYAAQGDLASARVEFERGGEAAGRYNMGIVHMAQRRYKRAAEAFEAALQADPSLTLAAARVRQSRTLLARHGDTDGDDD